MSDQGNQGNNEQFTGLILLSGDDKPGISQALFETLAPFSITILDIEQVVIKNRLVLTTLISLNPAHEKAVAEDLEACALALDVDIATLFSYVLNTEITDNPSLVQIVVASNKLEPSAIAQISSSIASLGGNIERAARIASTPSTAIEFFVSGASQQELSQVLGLIAASNNVSISIKPADLQLPIK